MRLAIFLLSLAAAALLIGHAAGVRPDAVAIVILIGVAVLLGREP